MFNLSNLKPEEVLVKLEAAKSIIKDIEFLTDTYVLDFFVENIWEKLPEDWRNYFETLNFPQISTILDYNSTNDDLVPKTFQELKMQLRELSLSREFEAVKTSNLKAQLPLYKLLQNPKSKFISNFFRGVKQKKKYEILIMSNLIYNATIKQPVDLIIDVGGGLGHLSRILCYVYNLKLICIDGNPNFQKEAKNLNSKMQNYINRNNPDLELQTPKNITYMIQPNITNETFEKLIQDECDFEIKTFGIIGLHPCGDLASTLLRLYKSSNKCKFINIASCCYMKLTTEEQPNTNFHNYGFPISDLCKGLKLSYAARELACHAIETYRDKLLFGDIEDLKVHAYRATLEQIIFDKYPNRRREQIKSIKYKPGLSFSEYSIRALRASDLELDQNVFGSEKVENMLRQWNRVVIFYSLRLMVAPLLESIIFMDRYLFLNNDDNVCEIRPFFDPKISPRTHILIANKI